MTLKFTFPNSDSNEIGTFVNCDCPSSLFLLILGKVSKSGFLVTFYQQLISGQDPPNGALLETKPMG